MKKTIKLIFALAMTLCAGCSQTSTSSSTETSAASSSVETSVDFSSLKIVTPTGAPSVAFYNYSDNPNFSTNSTPSNIVSFMTGQSDYDIVVIDTTSGIKAINNGAEYKIAATLTFGNFFIAATGNDDDGVMDKDDKIVLFGQNQTPDLLFHHLYGNELDNAIEYVTAVSDAATCLASGKNLTTGSSVDYVFIAQPVLFATLNNQNAATYGKASVYANVQDLYKQKNNDSTIIQASLFVKNSADKTKVNAFLTSLQSDVEAALADPEVIATGMGKIDEDKATALYGVKAAPIKATIKNNNSLGLGFKKASDIKTDIDTFVSLFSLTTNEEIYYK